MIPMRECLVFAATFLLSFVIVRMRNDKRNAKRRYPPSLPSVPILGSLPFLLKFGSLSQFFTKTTSELGPVFTFQIGNRLILVLSTLEAIENAFVKHASSFSGRESFYAEKYVANPKQKGISLIDYTAELSKHRRLTLSLLRDFGFGSRRTSDELIQAELSCLIDHIKTFNGNSFDPRNLIIHSASNVPCKALLGRRREYDEGLSEAMILALRNMDFVDPAVEFFPILRFLPSSRRKVAGYVEANARIVKQLDDDARASLQDGTIDCFVRRYIEKEGPDYDHDQLIHTVRDFFEAGLETTANVLSWSIIYLINYPKVAERIQQEIDLLVPRDRLPNNDDQQSLPFIQATILEIIRHRTPTPIGVPHRTLHDTEVLGYAIPANTLVLPNFMSAHMNLDDWPNADIFMPERFLDENNRLINKNKVIPFSLGRRSCPGETLARRLLFLFIAGLMQNFSFLPAEGEQSITDEVGNKVTNIPPTYTIRMIPRQR